jgi:uncharacterized protein YjbI with pentapeptide repeats
VSNSPHGRVITTEDDVDLIVSILEVAVVVRVRSSAQVREPHDANLAGADLTDANFTGTQLAYANLTDANLTDANLTDANLTDANLAYANLTGADLSGTILSNTQLYCATMPDGKINNNGC